uniref:SsDNA binding protein n=1 Tax=Pseudomonas phage Touem01 TaxID=3138548 RepID=A0AAU6W2C6_9VIRU
MSQELIQQASHHGQLAAQMGQSRGLSSNVNAGSVSIESERAVAEARGQIQIAQMFPRDVAAARAELMAECDSFEFASVASYAVPRAGGTVTGPSIRLAEAVASAYGHMEWGHRELSRGDGKSEVEVYAWDKQKNNRRIRQITVDHFRDTRNGPVPLRDSKDIDDKIANVASKQMRGAILALVPKSFTEAAIARCKTTLAGGGGVPLKERIAKMTDAFAKMGVTTEILKKHLGHTLDSINGDELTDLIAIYNAIKGGDKINDHFGNDEDGDGAGTKTAAVITKTADEGSAKKNGPAAAAAAKASSKTVTKDSKPVEAEKKPEVVETAQAEPQPETAKDPEVELAAQPEQASADDAGQQSTAEPEGAATPEDDVF